MTTTTDLDLDPIAERFTRLELQANGRARRGATPATIHIRPSAECRCRHLAETGCDLSSEVALSLGDLSVRQRLLIAPLLQEQDGPGGWILPGEWDEVTGDGLERLIGEQAAAAEAAAQEQARQAEAIEIRRQEYLAACEAYLAGGQDKPAFPHYTIAPSVMGWRDRVDAESRRREQLGEIERLEALSNEDLGNQYFVPQYQDLAERCAALRERWLAACAAKKARIEADKASARQASINLGELVVVQGQDQAIEEWEISGGAVALPIRGGDKCWMATWTPPAGAGKRGSRAFWDRPRDGFRSIPADLAVGDLVEAAADDKKKKHRAHYRVLAIRPGSLVVRGSSPVDQGPIEQDPGFLAIAGSAPAAVAEPAAIADLKSEVACLQAELALAKEQVADLARQLAEASRVQPEKCAKPRSGKSDRYAEAREKILAWLPSAPETFTSAEVGRALSIDPKAAYHVIFHLSHRGGNELEKLGGGKYRVQGGVQ